MPFYIFMNRNTGRLKIFDWIISNEIYWIDNNKWRSSKEMDDLGYELIGEL
jgi:hypothetical protein